MDLELTYDKIYRYCYYKLNNRELAEDVTQEAFLRFFKSGYEDRGKEMQYLYTIAKNLCMDEFRKRKYETVLSKENMNNISFSEEGEGSSGFAVTYESGFEKKVVNEISVKDALQKLPEEDREILLMRFANEEAISVIAEVYGMSRFALYRKIKQALNRIRILLE